MKAASLGVLWIGMLASAEVLAAPCSSYYISEITLVSAVDTEAGRVQTFVGFGASKEEAENNALGSCSHIQLDLQTCLDSDRRLGRNAPSDQPDQIGHSVVSVVAEVVLASGEGPTPAGPGTRRLVAYSDGEERAKASGLKSPGC